jgi:hypothetical protein
LLNFDRMAIDALRDCPLERDAANCDGGISFNKNAVSLAGGGAVIFTLDGELFVIEARQNPDGILGLRRIHRALHRREARRQALTAGNRADVADRASVRCEWPHEHKKTCP